jgi:hypothetical protein
MAIGRGDYALVSRRWCHGSKMSLDEKNVGAEWIPRLLTRNVVLPLTAVRNPENGTS